MTRATAAAGAAIARPVMPAIMPIAITVKTASGERYRNNLNSAAHMELPFGSMVRVTNLANGKSVVVKVNDRGAFKNGRIIHLKSAFSTIGNIREGIIKVKVEVL